MGNQHPNSRSSFHHQSKQSEASSPKYDRKSDFSSNNMKEVLSARTATQPQPSSNLKKGKNANYHSKHNTPSPFRGKQFLLQQKSNNYTSQKSKKFNHNSQNMSMLAYYNPSSPVVAHQMNSNFYSNKTGLPVNISPLNVKNTKNIPINPFQNSGVIMTQGSSVYNLSPTTKDLSPQLTPKMSPAKSQVKINNREESKLFDSNASHRRKRNMIIVYIKFSESWIQSIEVQDSYVYNCEWLKNQVIRLYSEGIQQRAMEESKKIRKMVIVNLKTVKRMRGIDMWLTQASRSLCKLKTGDVLEPIFGRFLSNKDNKVCLQDFEIVKCIGKGGFAKVFKVRRKQTGQIYAMKVIEKIRIVKTKKVLQAFQELSIMSKLDSPFLIKLYYAFQSPKYLHLLMDFCPGGQLFYNMTKRPKFSEQEAKFIFCEAFLGVQYLHDHNILYRDLKPQNVLIDMDGHIKLTDFGLSKQLQNRGQVSYSFCGSPQYMSPQMLSGQGHGPLLDCYTLGVLLFQMLNGLPPHYSKNTDIMYQRIKQEKVEIPRNLVGPVRSFLLELLAKAPEKRLGAKGGLKEIKQHPWLADVDWQAKKQLKEAPIWTPNLRSGNIDTEYVNSPLDKGIGDIIIVNGQIADNQIHNQIREDVITELDDAAIKAGFLKDFNQSTLQRIKDTSISTRNYELNTSNYQNSSALSKVSQRIPTIQLQTQNSKKYRPSQSNYISVVDGIPPFSTYIDLKKVQQELIKKSQKGGVSFPSGPADLSCLQVPGCNEPFYVFHGYEFEYAENFQIHPILKAAKEYQKRIERIKSQTREEQLQYLQSTRDKSSTNNSIYSPIVRREKYKSSIPNDKKPCESLASPQTSSRQQSHNSKIGVSRFNNKTTITTSNFDTHKKQQDQIGSPRFSGQQVQLSNRVVQEQSKVGELSSTNKAKLSERQVVSNSEKVTPKTSSSHDIKKNIKQIPLVYQIEQEQKKRSSQKLYQNNLINQSKQQQNFSNISMSYQLPQSQLKMMLKSTPHTTPNSQSQIHTPKQEIVSLKPSVLDYQCGVSNSQKYSQNVSINEDSYKHAQERKQSLMSKDNFSISVISKQNKRLSQQNKQQQQSIQFEQYQQQGMLLQQSYPPPINNKKNIKLIKVPVISGHRQFSNNESLASVPQERPNDQAFNFKSHFPNRGTDQKHKTMPQNNISNRGTQSNNMSFQNVFKEQQQQYALNSSSIVINSAHYKLLKQQAAISQQASQNLDGSDSIQQGAKMVNILNDVDQSNGQNEDCYDQSKSNRVVNPTTVKKGKIFQVKRMINSLSPFELERNPGVLKQSLKQSSPQQLKNQLVRTHLQYHNQKNQLNNTISQIQLRSKKNLRDGQNKQNCKEFNMSSIGETQSSQSYSNLDDISQFYGSYDNQNSSLNKSNTFLKKDEQGFLKYKQMEQSVKRSSSTKKAVSPMSNNIRKIQSVLFNRKSPATPKYSSQNSSNIQSQRKHTTQERKIQNHKLVMELNSNSGKKNEGGVVNISIQKSSPFFYANSKRIVEKQLFAQQKGGKSYLNSSKSQKLHNQPYQYIIPQQANSKKNSIIMNKSRNTFERNTNHAHSQNKGQFRFQSNPKQRDQQQKLSQTFSYHPKSMLKKGIKNHSDIIGQLVQQQKKPHDVSLIHRINDSQASKQMMHKELLKSGQNNIKKKMILMKKKSELTINKNNYSTIEGLNRSSDTNFDLSFLGNNNSLNVSNVSGTKYDQTFEKQQQSDRIFSRGIFNSQSKVYPTNQGYSSTSSYSTIPKGKSIKSVGILDLQPIKKRNKSVRKVIH